MKKLALILLLIAFSAHAKETPQASAAKEVNLPVVIVANEKGAVTEIKLEEKYAPLKNFVSDEVQKLSFEPAKIAGKPVPSEFNMSLKILATPKSNNDYDLVLQKASVVFSEGGQQYTPPPSVHSLMQAGVDASYIVEYTTKEDGSMDQDSLIFHYKGRSLDKNIKKDLENSIRAAALKWPSNKMIINGQPVRFRMFVPVEFCTSGSRKCGTKDFPLQEYRSGALDPEISVPAIKEKPSPATPLG